MKTALTERLTSSKSNLWATPRDVAARLVEEFDLKWDAAACSASNVMGRNNAYFGPDHEDGLTDALTLPWSYADTNRFFLNPPFDQLAAFAHKAAATAQDGALVVALLPANKTEQPWWHETIPQAAEVRWVRGRLTYLEPELDYVDAHGTPVYKLNGTYTAKTPALFPSAVVVWDGRTSGLSGSPRMTFWEWRSA